MCAVLNKDPFHNIDNSNKTNENKLISISVKIPANEVPTNTGKLSTKNTGKLSTRNTGKLSTRHIVNANTTMLTIFIHWLFTLFKSKVKL